MAAVNVAIINIFMLLIIVVTQKSDGSCGHGNGGAIKKSIGHVDELIGHSFGREVENGSKLSSRQEATEK